MLFLPCLSSNAQENSLPDFKWGSASYFNLNVGDSIFYNSTEIKLLKLNNHFNKIQVGIDTLWIKVSKRSLPIGSTSLRLFVADNVNVKTLTDDKKVHGLLSKDALLCVSDLNERMLDPNCYRFPVSFNDGFLWSAEEDSHMFSYMGKTNTKNGGYLRSYEGIGIDLNDARGIEKHWLVAIENSTVVWVEDKKLDILGKQACVLLKSDANSGIYYVYNYLYNKNVEVKKGQKLLRGELIGTAWGDQNWGHLQFVVVQSDSVPTYENRFRNTLNFFPQFYELYFKESYNISKSFTRGKIEFGKPTSTNRNQKNTSAFEGYLGKGWLWGTWNKSDKIECVERSEEGNGRLRKVLFSGTKAESVNPNDYYDYEVNVKNGVYRVRAKVGDLYLPSWQKIDFEGVATATYSLDSGELKWTSERVVKVTDRKLTIRIYIDESNKKIAGLSEIVFQRVY